MTWEQIHEPEPECIICVGKLDNGDCPECSQAEIDIDAEIDK